MLVYLRVNQKFTTKKKCLQLAVPFQPGANRLLLVQCNFSDFVLGNPQTKWRFWGWENQCCQCGNFQQAWCFFVEPLEFLPASGFVWKRCIPCQMLLWDTLSRENMGKWWLTPWIQSLFPTTQIELGNLRPSFQRAKDAKELLRHLPRPGSHPASLAKRGAFLLQE